MRKTVLVLLALLPLSSLAAGNFVVKDMRVEGLQRISEGTVFNYLPINIGDEIDGVRIGEAIRALYGQDLFDNIEMRREGDTLIIVVKERPSIESFTIDGNKDIKTEDLMDSLRSVGLARGRTFDRSVLDNVEMFLREQYYDRGKYGVVIESEILDRPNNTVRSRSTSTKATARRFARSISWAMRPSMRDEIRDRLRTRHGKLAVVVPPGRSLRERVARRRSRNAASFYMDRGYADFRD